MTDDTNDTETEQPRNVTVHLKHPVDAGAGEPSPYGKLGERRHIVVEGVVDAYVGKPPDPDHSLAGGGDDSAIFKKVDGGHSTFRLDEVIGWESEPADAPQEADGDSAARTKPIARDLFREMQTEQRRHDSSAN